MDDFSNPCRTRKLEVINGNGYAFNNNIVFAVGSDRPSNHRPPPLSLSTPPSGMFDGRRTTSSTTNASAKSKCMFDGREMKRRKRVAKYKWYAVEGKVKASFKDGYHWFKRRCSQIVRGF